MKLVLFLINFSLLIISIVSDSNNNEVEVECNITKKLRDEIQSYSSIVNKIIKAVVDGDHKGTTYSRLATFIDKFGPRFTATQNLENAIDYMINKSSQFDLENVRYENVTIPHWVRGNETATLLSPRRQNLRMLGLGYSVGTPSEGIQADAIVVHDFNELRNVGNKVKGKIVVYDVKFISYGATVIYRSKGASEAAKYGAVAALVSSITPFSLNTPHTGMQSYEETVKKIPVACITPQDAHMLTRMQNRGESIVIHLKMDARNLEPKTSRNTIAEIRGHTHPDKVVVVSGHLDSWDVGQGAMDDGGGAFLSWNSLVVLKALGLRPKRTMRVILWTAEEMGLIGAASYVDEHRHELNHFNFVMESDAGTFYPTGLAVSGTNEAVCIIQEVLNLLSPINTTNLQQPQQGPDISYFTELGVPGGSLLNKNENYYTFHHSEGDTMDLEDPKALDLATALWASVSYVIADLSEDIPKKLTV